MSARRNWILALWAAQLTAQAWVTAPVLRQSTRVGALAAPSNSNIEDELRSGRVLEGGAVIDFSSVKASSRAETALAQAKLTIDHRSATSDGILGINDDVVREVGHPLGEFATEEQIQECASYLRSQASSGLFESKENLASSPRSPESIIASQRILDRVFEESGEVTSAFAKTFYLGTKLLDSDAQKAIWAIYVWCRRTDEIVDAPRENEGDMLKDLSLWESRLQNLWKFGEVVDVYDLGLLDCLVKYPNLDVTPFSDMIRGMLMDVPELGQEVYETFDELHLYCYRVAGTVGLMSLPVFGCAEGFTDDLAR